MYHCVSFSLYLTYLAPNNIVMFSKTAWESLSNKELCYQLFAFVEDQMCEKENTLKCCDVILFLLVLTSVYRERELSILASNDKLPRNQTRL